MKIITISREFGSGGRELGHRLADLLGIPCYDEALIRAAAERQGIDPSQVERISRQEIPICYALTAGRRLAAPRRPRSRLSGPLWPSRRCSGGWQSRGTASSWAGAPA